MTDFSEVTICKLGISSTLLPANDQIAFMSTETVNFESSTFDVFWVTVGWELISHLMCENRNIPWRIDKFGDGCLRLPIP